MRTVTEQEARARLERAISAAGGLNAYARQTGCSATAVCFARRGYRPVFGKLARALGLHVVVHKSISYVEAA
jgi:hypothetical protein